MCVFNTFFFKKRTLKVAPTPHFTYEETEADEQSSGVRRRYAIEVKSADLQHSLH